MQAVNISRPLTFPNHLLIENQIAHSDMYHPVSGINSLIHSASLASHVSTYLLRSSVLSPEP